MSNKFLTYVALTALVLLIAVAITGLWSEGPLVVVETRYGLATWYEDGMVAGGMPYHDGNHAAMWDVELGTRVRVTDLETGHSILVVVNDRGPARELVARGRVIDLTKSAFRYLVGGAGKDVVDVKVDILGRRRP